MLAKPQAPSKPPVGPAPVVSGSGRTPATLVGKAAVPSSEASLKEALLAEIRKSKVVFYNTVVAQAQKIDVTADRVTFAFGPAQRTLRDMFEQNRAWLEGVARQVAGRTVAVVGAQNDNPTPSDQADSAQKVAAPDPKSALRAQALADAGVQAMLEVFPAEIRDVEEM